jgi:hypothetical protein
MPRKSDTGCDRIRQVARHRSQSAGYTDHLAASHIDVPGGHFGILAGIGGENRIPGKRRPKARVTACGLSTPLGLFSDCSIIVRQRFIPAWACLRNERSVFCCRRLSR